MSCHSVEAGPDTRDVGDPRLSRRTRNSFIFNVVGSSFPPLLILATCMTAAHRGLGGMGLQLAHRKVSPFGHEIHACPPLTPLAKEHILTSNGISNTSHPGEILKPDGS